MGTHNDWRVDDRFASTIDDSRRPFLIDLRLLQEALLGNIAQTATTGGGGGAGPNPANGVTAAGSFGLPASAGVAATFSRGDHTHGTPPDPIPPHKADPNAHTLAGDVAGPTGTSVVERLRGVVVDPAAPAAGQVLGFSNGRWRPTAIATPPGAGNAVKTETSFGLATATGVDNNYARADHTHGTPPDPIPPHRGDPNAHQLLGDVTGSLGATVVSRIQNLPVQVPSAANSGMALTFRPAGWTLEPAAGGTASAVERPAGQPRYLIVAAGRVAMNGTTRGPAYNGLTASAVPTAPGIINVKFNGYINPEPNFPHQYIIKVLPEALLPSQAGSIVTLAVDVAFNAYDQGGFSLIANTSGQRLSANDTAKLILQIEVSQYLPG